MAKVLSYNHTDTTVTGGTAVVLTLPQLNYGADFRVKVDDPGEAVITNLTSPRDCPETLRFACQDVANVYTNSGIDPSLSAPSKRGTNLLVQLNDVLTVTDDAVPEYRVDYPISVHLVIKVPKDTMISVGVVENEVKRLLAGLYETDKSSATRLNALLRGALLPSSL